MESNDSIKLEMLRQQAETAKQTQMIMQAQMNRPAVDPVIQQMMLAMNNNGAQMQQAEMLGAVTRAAFDPQRAPALIAGALYVAENSFYAKRMSSTISIQCRTGTGLAWRRCSRQPMLAVAMTDGWSPSNAASCSSSWRRRWSASRH